MAISDVKKRHVRDILDYAVAAVDPFVSVGRVLSRSSDNLLVHTQKGTKRYLLKAYKNLWVVGCGMAGTPMSLALEEIVGERISGGIVTVKHGHTGPSLPERITIIEAGHPEPDAAGLGACRDTIELLKKANYRNLVIALISGGGSALWPQPVPPITLDEKKEVTRLLLAAGADIHEMDTVLKHLSLIKGGFAAVHACPAEVVVVGISDVIGDEIDTIASGPCAPDTTTCADAWQVAMKYRLLADLPDSVSDYLQRGVGEMVDDTPGVRDRAFQKVKHVICASNRIALEAASDKARILGYEPIVVSGQLTGDCLGAAKDFCLRLRALQQGGRGKPRCIITGGETTVTPGKNYDKGGRNQEFALASAFVIEETEDVVVASFSTDGTPSSLVSPSSALSAEPRMIGTSSPGNLYCVNSSRTSSSTRSSSSGSSTMSHLFKYTTM